MQWQLSLIALCQCLAVISSCSSSPRSSCILRRRQLCICHRILRSSSSRSASFLKTDFPFAQNPQRPGVQSCRLDVTGAAAPTISSNDASGLGMFPLARALETKTHTHTHAITEWHHYDSIASHPNMPKVCKHNAQLLFNSRVASASGSMQSSTLEAGAAKVMYA